MRKKRLPPKDDAIELAKRLDTQTPDPADVARFRQLIKERPDAWRVADNLMSQARDQYIQSLNMSAINKEVIRQHLAEMVEDLREPEDTPLVSMLVDQVALCYLRLAIVEQQYTAQMSGSISLTLAQHWDKHLAAAQKRYLKACEALARTRKLTRPPRSKLNIGTVNALLNGEPVGNLVGPMAAAALRAAREKRERGQTL